MKKTNKLKENFKIDYCAENMLKYKHKSMFLLKPTNNFLGGFIC